MAAFGDINFADWKPALKTVTTNNIEISERSSAGRLALRTPSGVHCACFLPLASVQSFYGWKYAN